MSDGSQVLPFPDTGQEADFQAARRMLLDPPPSRQKVLLLVVTLIGFAGASFVGDPAGSLVELAMLIGVLLVHELGHVAGMRLFGYRDVQMFFIPFMGAAATGRRHGVARWKEGVVLLLGPLPGILAGATLAWAGGPPPVHSLALLLIAVNAANLLPIAPLDGGQLFLVTLFSRNRHLELAFVGLAGGLLVWAGLAVSLVLTVLGAILLISIGHRRRVLATGWSLRDEGLSADPAQLLETQGRLLYRTSWDSLPPTLQAHWRGRPRLQAEFMEQVLERATQRPPSAGATAGLLLAWFLGLVVAAAGLIPLALTDIGSQSRLPPMTDAPSWRMFRHDAPRFVVEVPGAPHVVSHGAGKGSLEVHVGPHRYSVTWTPVSDRKEWLAQRRARFADLGGIEDVGVSDCERVVTQRLPNLFQRMRLFVAGATGFEVVASAVVSVVDAPGRSSEADAKRFVDSFCPDRP